MVVSSVSSDYDRSVGQYLVRAPGEAARPPYIIRYGKARNLLQLMLSKVEDLPRLLQESPAYLLSSFMLTIRYPSGGRWYYYGGDGV